ncbi:hypothetical protein HN011_012406 [Eciton burchellii]|nr:hypothetical protein HN011_012406 [Eciton burchellii]
MLKIRMLDYIGDTGRQQLDQSVYCEPDSRRANNIEDDRRDVQSKSEKVKNTTQDLFELLERVQSSRLDDQRCVLPSYFSQVCNKVRTRCTCTSRGDISSYD